MKYPTLLITGGSGFIGRNLVEKLPAVYRIFAPSHRELDLLDSQAVEEYFRDHKIDVVIHCSNIGGTRSTINFPNVARDNLRIFFNIIRVKKMYKKMIFLGSGAEYDKKRSLSKVKESDFDKYIPSDEYGFYKYICSKYIQISNNIINLRLFAVYGKYEDKKIRFISEAICRNIKNLPIIINQNAVFDYLYIDDLVKIINFFILKKVKDKFFNVGRGVGIDLVTIAEKINSISEKKPEIIIKKKGKQNEYTCDNSLLLKTLGNFVFTDFQISLKELSYYYKSIKAIK